MYCQWAGQCWNILSIGNWQVSLGEQFSSLLSISNALQVLAILMTRAIAVLVWVILMIDLNPDPQSLILDPWSRCLICDPWSRSTILDPDGSLTWRGSCSAAKLSFRQRCRRFSPLLHQEADQRKVFMLMQTNHKQFKSMTTRKQTNDNQNKNQWQPECKSMTTRMQINDNQNKNQYQPMSISERNTRFTCLGSPRVGLTSARVLSLGWLTWPGPWKVSPFFGEISLMIAQSS